MVAGAWMGLAVKTDGAAVAGGYLAEGTRALQDGTGPAADGVLDASLSPALAQAWLEAAAERAAEALASLYRGERRKGAKAAPTSAWVIR